MTLHYLIHKMLFNIKYRKRSRAWRDMMFDIVYTVKEERKHDL